MPLGDDPLSGFIRGLGPVGMVATATSSGSIVPERVRSPRSAQQLFRSYQDQIDSFQLLQCQSNLLALQASTDGSLITAEPNPGDPGQQWRLSSDGFLSSVAMGEKVLAIRGNAYSVVARAPNDTGQKFEYVFPAAEFYIRNSRTGLFLIALAENNEVIWGAMSETEDARQRWYNTPSRRLMNRATGKVLEVDGSMPGISKLRVADAMAVGPAAGYQSFVHVDGTLRCLAAESLAVGGGRSIFAILEIASSSDLTQLIQFVSPFSFFLLKSALPQPAGAPAVDLWLTFNSDDTVAMARQPTRARNQLFSVSDFGQVFCAAGGQVAFFPAADGSPIDMRAISMTAPVLNNSFSQVTFQFVSSSGGGGAIKFPASWQFWTVTRFQGVTITEGVNNPARYVQIWDIVDPLAGAMRFFMENAVIAFGNPAAFPVSG